jgi:hypothetical protein
MDKDMNTLMKNFRVDFMKQIKDNEKIHQTLDFSDAESESRMYHTRQITPLSVPNYT